MIDDEVERIFEVLFEEFGQELPQDDAAGFTPQLYALLHESLCRLLREEMRLQQRDFIEQLRTAVCTN